MSWRLTQIVFLSLAAVAWPHQGAGTAAPTAGPRACQLSWVDGGDGPARAQNEADRPSLHTSSLPQDCAPCAQRGDQLRVELRQPGVKAWIAPAPCASAGESPGWVSGLRTAPTSPSRLRLHALLCTWLI